MAQDKATTWDRLSRLWADDHVPTLPLEGCRYVVISDLHLGDGGSADDFHPNEAVLLDALTHYRQDGYSVVLLGDIEEFWQFDLPAIEGRYGGSVYAALRALGDDRLHRVFGNHDLEWGGYRDPARRHSQQPGIAAEALKLVDSAGQAVCLLVHGHQGSLDADKWAWFSRFVVRLFKGVEPLARLTGLYGERSAPKSPIAKDYEQVMYAWAKDHHALLVCAHSHRAMFASRFYAEMLQDQIAALQAKSGMSRMRETTRREAYREIARLSEEYEEERSKGRVIETVDPNGAPRPCYYNSGCCLYTDGITALELADGEIRLVKWDKEASGEVQRHVYHSSTLDDVLARVRGEKNEYQSQPQHGHTAMPSKAKNSLSDPLTCRSWSCIMGNEPASYASGSHTAVPGVPSSVGRTHEPKKGGQHTDTHV
ncbi:MAG: hypothetical protein FJZ90_02700 [Chloroflexi bacterium]|nr:hypothetical protein [Chloroflexota bacterium]